MAATNVLTKADAEFAAAMDKIIIARVSAMLNQPFWGRLVPRLKVVDVTDEGWCPTAATDGSNLFINRHFVNGLPNSKQVLFLIAHEVGHCVLDHFSRRGERDAQMWNVAGDYYINAMLIRNRVGERITTVPILYDAKYEDLCTEEIYEKLMENPPSDMPQTLDVHLDVRKPGDGPDSDKPGRSISEAQARDVKDLFRQAVLDAAQQAGMDKVPDQIRALLKEFTEPKINWRELLQQTIQSMIKTDYSWIRPNKKMQNTGIYLPGNIFDETVDLCVAIDVSGSIDTDILHNIFSEINGLMAQYPGFKIKVWSFDTSVREVRDYDESNGHELMNYPLYAGGGTDFMCNWKWMKEEGVEPRKLVVITDMYPFGGYGDPDYCDVIWIAHSNPDPQPPFGVVAKYDPKI